MIWFTLALFAVSFVLTALLAPKPDFENARPEGLDPNNFPQATEDAPIPLVLGTVRIAGPNTLYYGDFQTVPITERIKVNLFKKTTVTVGYNYYITLDLGVCLGPGVQLSKIFIDETEVFDGTASYPSGTTVRYQDNYTVPEGFATEVDRISDLADLLGVSTVDLDALLDAEEVTMDLVLGPYEFFNVIDGQPFTGQADIRIRCYDDLDGAGSILSPVTPGFSDAGETYFLEGDDGTSLSQTLAMEDLVVPPDTRSIVILSRELPAVNIQHDFRLLGAHTFKLYTEGVLIDSINFDIYEPNLYGGFKSGGGHIGNTTFYDGKFDQIVDPSIEESVGTGEVPAYRGMAHIVMPNHYIGETPALRKIEFEVSKFSNILGLADSGRIGADMNPAEAIYYMMTNNWAGLDIPTAQLDTTSFQSVGAILATEENGVSVKVAATRQGKDIINEVLRQIDGVLVQDDNNLVSLKLIRNDYDAGTLDVYDEDDIVEITSYTKTAWEDVKSRVKLSYASREKEGNRIAEAQNMATFGMIGRINTAEVSMPFCYDPALANRLAARELSQLSTPLLRMTLTMNRNGFQIRTGDVFKVSWSEYGITELIVRAQKVSLGSLNDNKVTIEVVQDIFAIGTAVFGTPEDTGWTDTRPSPENITTFQTAEMPRFFQKKLDEPISDGFGSIIPFPKSPKVASASFDLRSSEIAGEYTIADLENVVYPLSAQFNAEYLNTAGFETGLDATGFTIKSLAGNLGNAPEDALEADIKTGDAGLIYANGEWMSYEGVTDNMDDTYTLDNINRGLLGTIPLTHAADSQLYFFNTDLLDKSTLGAALLEDGTAYYKLLDRVGAEVQALAQVVGLEKPLADIADRPLRPRLLEIDGARTEVPFNGSGDPTRSLSWLASNREASEIAFEDDVAETPDQTEQYDLEVWIDGVQDMSLSDDNITQPYPLDLTGATGSSGELRLYSKRTGGDTKASVYYAWYPFTLSLTMDSTDITMDDTSVRMDRT